MLSIILGLPFITEVDHAVIVTRIVDTPCIQIENGGGAASFGRVLLPILYTILLFPHHPFYFRNVSIVKVPV